MTISDPLPRKKSVRENDPQVSDFPFASALSTKVAVSVCSRFGFSVFFDVLQMLFVFIKVS